MLTNLFDGVTNRGKAALALFALALLAWPLVANPYLLAIGTLILWFAYVGQAWNVMMGFAGQLSLGHTLYVGLGGYVAAGLFVKLGIGPWAGVWVATLVAALAGLVIGWLGFRFGIKGVHFALLTIAFAEFTRVAFDHLTPLGGSGGMFLPVDQRAGIDILNLRGPPAMYYYAMMALVAAALLACRLLLRSRIGYYWQAIREDQEAASAVGINVFRYKLLAVVVSAAMTAPAGVFYAFYYNNLFPEQVFAMNRSIEILLGAIVGGVGTVFGPILGAFILTPLGETMTNLLEHIGITVPGAKQVFYGFALVVIVLFQPAGIWPWVARRLRLVKGDGQ